MGGFIEVARGKKLGGISRTYFALKFVSNPTRPGGVCAREKITGFPNQLQEQDLHHGSRTHQRHR
jgi:hypothetical protein